jgi:hypothetical protein
VAENLGEALKRYLRDSSRWFSIRDRSHTLLKANETSDPWLGHTRTFGMIREVTPENPQIPPDEKEVARRAPQIIAELPEAFAAYINSSLSRDRGNLAAAADVIDPDTGDVIGRNVPAITLMAWNKAMGECVALANDAPVAPAGDRWERDPRDPEILSARPVETIRNQRQRRAVKIADESERHPAQYIERDEDVPVAMINHIKHHGGFLPAEKRALVARAQRLQLAVAQALERANGSNEAPEVTGVGEAMAALLWPRVDSL